MGMPAPSCQQVLCSLPSAPQTCTGPHGHDCGFYSCLCALLPLWQHHRLLAHLQLMRAAELCWRFKVVCHS